MMFNFIVDNRADRESHLELMKEEIKERDDVIAAQVEELSEALKIASNARYRVSLKVDFHFYLYFTGSESFTKIQNRS